MFRRGLFLSAVISLILLSVTNAQAAAVLWAVSQFDDPAYRAAVQSFLPAGSTVSYFDTRSATPSLTLLQNFDAVSILTNFEHHDNVNLGNTLADYVDTGGRLILGPFSAPTANIYLSGRIMGWDYSPVAAAGQFSYTEPSYAGDGSLFYTGVSSLRFGWLSPLRLQGTGVKNGSYTGGDILLAYRHDFRVFYMNGTGWYAWGVGDWARLEANLIMYGKQGPSVPEPATVGLSVGALALFALSRRRR